MPEQNEGIRDQGSGVTSNGSGHSNGNGNGSGKVSSLISGAKAVQARAVEELKETVKAPEKTDLWKSVLRVKHD